MNRIKCLNPWDNESKHVFDISGISEALYAGECRWGGGEHYVCYERDNVYAIDSHPADSRFEIACDITPTLTVKLAKGSSDGPLVMIDRKAYAIEGNVVDRVSMKNGKGWCEDVSPTLNTQDRHAVCFQFCGDRDNPSVSVSETAYCIPANPMSDRGQAVCYRK